MMLLIPHRSHSSSNRDQHTCCFFVVVDDDATNFDCRTKDDKMKLLFRFYFFLVSSSLWSIFYRSSCWMFFFVDWKSSYCWCVVAMTYHHSLRGDCIVRFSYEFALMLLFVVCHHSQYILNRAGCTIPIVVASFLYLILLAKMMRCLSLLVRIVLGRQSILLDVLVVGTVFTLKVQRLSAPSWQDDRSLVPFFLSSWWQFYYTLSLHGKSFEFFLGRIWRAITHKWYTTFRGKTVTDVT
jgi:hypothetical protein